MQTIPIGHIVELRLGQKTQPFERRTQSHKYEHESYDRSFSLILMSGKTLDFVTASTLEFKLWVHSLIRLILSVQMEGPSFVYLFYTPPPPCAPYVSASSLYFGVAAARQLFGVISLTPLHSLAACVAQGQKDRGRDLWRALSRLPCAEHPQVAGQGVAAGAPSLLWMAPVVEWH